MSAEKNIEEPSEAEAPSDNGTAWASPLTDDAPKAPPDGARATPNGEDLDALLEQYDRENTSPAPPAEPNALDELFGNLDQQRAQNDQLEQQLRDLTGQSVADQGRYQSEINNLRTAVEQSQAAFNHLQRQLWVASEERDFGSFASEVQAKLPEHIPSDYADAKLRTWANSDPALAIAWDARHINPQKIMAELDLVQRALTGLYAMPLADPVKVQALQEYGNKLAIASRSKEILSHARNRLIEEAKVVKPPADDLETIDRAAVAWSLRGASRKHAAEPMPDLGRLSDQQFAEYKRSLGF